jgi:hypothetical protein
MFFILLSHDVSQTNVPSIRRVVKKDEYAVPSGQEELLSLRLASVLRATALRDVIPQGESVCAKPLLFDSCTGQRVEESLPSQY